MADVKMYHRPIPTWWWMRKRSYFIFVMRELSSIFVAWFVAYLLMFIAAVGRSEEAYQDFLDFASFPLVVLLNVVAMVFVLLHVVTWFSLTPKAMEVQVRGRPVPAIAVIASQYVGLVAVSAFVYWLVTR